MSTDELLQGLVAVESAYQQLDKQGVIAAMDLALADLGCLDQSLEPALAARLHRAIGMRLYLEHDLEGSERAFAAARASEPGYTLPEEIAPAGHPLHQAYYRLQLDELPTEPLARQVGWSCCWTDRARGTDVPVCRPSRSSWTIEAR